MFAEIRLLSVVLDQRGLVIEHIEMARRPRHEELNHPLGLRRVMQASVGAGLHSPGRRRFAAQQGGKGDPAQAPP